MIQFGQDISDCLFIILISTMEDDLIKSHTFSMVKLW